MEPRKGRHLVEDEAEDGEHGVDGGIADHQPPRVDGERGEVEHRGERAQPLG